MTTLLAALGLARGVEGSGNLGRSGGLTHGIGQGKKVVGAGAAGGLVRREAQDLPAAGRGEPLAVEVAQVVGMRFGVRRKRSEDGRLLGVDVGQRVQGAATAGGARTATETHALDATGRFVAVGLGSRRE